jgi:hypothetical protein
VRVAEALTSVLIFGSFYGFLYPAVLAGTLGLCARTRHGFRPQARDWVPLLAPAATYYYLAYLVADRQGWNVPYAVLTLSGIVAIGVVVACVARRPRALSIAAAVGVGAAIALWRLVPHQGITRLF